jgi:hypothetical protein
MARIVIAHSAHELDLEAAPAGLRGRERVGVAVQNARKNDPASDPRHTVGSRKAYRLPLSVPRRSAYSLGLPRPTDALPRLSLAPLPLQRGDPRLSFGTLQSEPPTLRDIAAPNPAIRSRACLASVSLGRGFVPLSRRTQLARWSGPELRRPNCDAWTRRTAKEGACRMLTASAEYSLHAKITPRQLMARPYAEGRQWPPTSRSSA